MGTPDGATIRQLAEGAAEALATELADSLPNVKPTQETSALLREFLSDLILAGVQMYLQGLKASAETGLAGWLED